MATGGTPRELRLPLALLSLLSPLVPGDRRARWRAEWRAELWHAHATGRLGARRVLSSFPHALALRWQESRPDMWLTDIRQAFRQIFHAPAFSAMVVLTLGIGIGANTLVYSILQSTVLAPLGPIDDEGLVYLWRAHESRQMRISVDMPSIELWRDSVAGLEEVHALGMQARHVSGPIGPDLIPVGETSPGLFALLGVHAHLGRTFAADEAQEGGANVVVLAHGLWQSAFGADADVLGETLLIDDAPYTVIGVLPSGFGLQAPHNQVRAWIPLVPETAPRGLTAVGRLAPDTSLEQLNAELAGVAIDPDGPMADWHGLAETPQQRVGATFSTVVWSFQGAVFLVLLIAGANTANLLMTRGSGRRREMAVRAALGAGRGRLVRQLLVESVFLSGAGGLLGLALALGGLELVELFRPGDLRYFETLRLDPSVLAVAAGLALSCGLVFGLAPAFQVSAGRLREGLADGGRSASDGPTGRRVRAGLVVAEVALSTVLLIGAGLLLVSFLRLLDTDPGFEADGVAAIRVVLPQSYSEDGPGRAAFWRQLEERLGTTLGPAAEAVGIASGVPPRTGVNFGKPEPADGPAADPEALQEMSAYTGLTAGAFEALRVPLVAGSTAIDVGEATPMVINETLARRLWGSTQVVGRQLGGSDEEPMQVVAVSGDVRAFGLATDFGNQQMFELLDDDWYPENWVVIRADDPLGHLPALRAVLADLEPEAVVGDSALVRDMLGDSVALQRFNAQLMVAFAAVALALAGIGLYGVLSYTVARRVPELGLRMALGASAGSVLGLVGRQGMLLLGLGLATGLAGGAMASRLIASQLHGVEPVDPLTYTAVAALLLAAGMSACALPAWRATRVDPLVALRSE